MNQQIRELLKKAEGRYFEEHEANELHAYADKLAARLEILRSVERAEAAIVDDTIASVRAQFKSLPDENGPVAMDIARRDFSLVLRYAASSMLMMDPNFIYDKLAVWYRTIIFALVRPEAIVFGFKKLIESMKRHLTQAEADAMAPYVEIVIEEFESNLKRQAA